MLVSVDAKEVVLTVTPRELRIIRCGLHRLASIPNAELVGIPEIRSCDVPMIDEMWKLVCRVAAVLSPDRVSR